MKRPTQGRLGIQSAFFDILIFASGFYLALYLLPVLEWFLNEITWVYVGTVVIYLFLHYRRIESITSTFGKNVARSVGYTVLAFLLMIGGLILSMGLSLPGYFYQMMGLYIIGFSILARFIFYIYTRLLFTNKEARLKVLLIGNNRLTKKVIGLLNRPMVGIEIVGILDNLTAKGETINDIPVLGKINTIEDMLDKHKIDLIVQIASAESTTTIMTLAEHRRIRYVVVPQILGIISRSIASMTVGDQIFIEPRGTVLSGWSQVGKRIFDILAAVLVSLIAIPVGVFIALLIKIEDPRANVLVGQKRVDGRSGKTFIMYRFRTLKKSVRDVEPTKENYQEFPLLLKKKINHPDASSIGKFLRRTHLIDLPQLINVFKGEMGIVGPRPPFKIEYEAYDWLDRKRLLIKPGMTGMWQVDRSKYTYDEMVTLDRKYVENWSFLLDIKILFKTAYKFFSGRI